jgi:hypothetical protein
MGRSLSHKPLLDVAAHRDGDGLNSSTTDAVPAASISGSAAASCCGGFGRRNLLVGVSFLLTFLTTGIGNGFGTLQTQLLKEGIYSSLCAAANATCIESLARNGTCSVPESMGLCVSQQHGSSSSCVLAVCSAQVDRLDSMYNMDFLTQNIVAAVIGLMVTAAGPRAVSCAGLVAVATGLLMLAYVVVDNHGYSSCTMVWPLILESL